MRVLVVGAGAVGGYFGGRLAQARQDVTFLVREARAQQLRERGLEIRSPHGNATIAPNIVTARELSAPYDLILLAVKTYALEQAIRDFTPAMGERSAVLPVLNGMRHIDVLSASFGASRVIGGVCVVATTLDDQGRILQLRDDQQLTYGELDGSHSARIDAIDATMQGAGFTARVSSSIISEMWEKWSFIAAVGASTCLLRGSTSDILAAPRGVEFMRALVSECAAVLDACGNPLSIDGFEKLRARMTNPQDGLTSSMYRDLQKGAPLEADAILGDFCARGEAAGLSSPLLSAAFAQLAMYETRRPKMKESLPDDLRAGLDAYRKNASAESWTSLSQLPVDGMDVLDALQLLKPDFPDPLPLPVEDLVTDNDAFYEWAMLPNPDDVERAIVAVLNKPPASGSA
ncbi:MAG: ketopantoate reductase family protein [Candidatus Eremiobacteraeota bacterium]|nr:ketopantoate reductase family protein [Candidatus Eremiobacteraeota bacterium]